MATTTSNFGWPIPQSTDLVKDGATAIASLGSGVDTSMAELKGGTTGQILSKTSNTDMDFTWVSPNPGDITGVTAGTGITGGGTSGDVTVSFDIANYGGGQYAAGKNKIINGDFGIWQRGTSFSTDGSYAADRWNLAIGGSGTMTVTQQSFTAGTAPVAGYEGQYYLQAVTASTSGTTDYKIVSQYVEDVRTFAGQTVTFSFWAKAGSGTPSIAVEAYQNFGSGGSSSVFTYLNKTAITTSWARYTMTVAIPSISGKTIGSSSYLGFRFWFSAGSDFNSRTGSLGNQNGTFGIWGVQVEAGSTASPFQTATGTKQGELAACQRYFFRAINGADDASESVGIGQWYNGTISQTVFRFPVIMRTAPTMAVSSAGHFTQSQGGATGKTVTSTAYYNTTPRGTHLDFTSSSATATAGTSAHLYASNVSATLDFSAEL